MATPIQIRDMDAKQIAELHIVERYLADQLSEEEAQAFEAYVEAHPEVTRDIENVSRMKAGLVALRQRGELSHLLRKERRRVPLLWALATSAAAILLAIVFLPRYWDPGADLPSLAAAAHQLTGDNRQPLPIAARLLVGRTRGEAPNTLASPVAESAVEIALDVHADPAARFSVELFRVSGMDLTSLGTLSNATPRADGTVSFFVRGSALMPGNYLIRAGDAGAAPDEFTLRVEERTP